MKKYQLTEEHRAQLQPWAEKWRKIIMSTEGMTPSDKEACRVAALGLYEAVGLPPPKHVVFVPSPFVLAFAGGFSAAIWHMSKCWNATLVATRDATRAATESATRAATLAEPGAATKSATWAATESATRAATAGGSNWYPDLRSSMRSVATSLGKDNAQFLLNCAQRAYNMWDGGNQWAQWVSTLSFFRHVARLNLDYSKWDHYEALTTLSGPRIMHPDFCMISDKPEKLTVDDQNRPHCADGPFCRWRDGTALYSWHGVMVPGWVVETPENINPANIEAEQNAEVRRVMIERYGVGRYVTDSRFEVLDADTDPLGQPRRLLRKDDLLVVELTNSTEDADGTRRLYHVPCHNELRPLLPDGTLGEPQELSALAAVASTYGLRAEEYVLSVET